MEFGQDESGILLRSTVAKKAGNGRKDPRRKKFGGW